MRPQQEAAPLGDLPTRPDHGETQVTTLKELRARSLYIHHISTPQQDGSSNQFEEYLLVTEKPRLEDGKLRMRTLTADVTSETRPYDVFLSDLGVVPNELGEWNPNTWLEDPLKAVPEQLVRGFRSVSGRQRRELVATLTEIAGSIPRKEDVDARYHRTRNVVSKDVLLWRYRGAAEVYARKKDPRYSIGEPVAEFREAVKAFQKFFDMIRLVPQEDIREALTAFQRYVRLEAQFPHPHTS